MRDSKKNNRTTFVIFDEIKTPKRSGEIKMEVDERGSETFKSRMRMWIKRS